MQNPQENYLLASNPAEMERLRLQARFWEPDAEKMLSLIGVEPGWKCLDLGCGALGILGPLSRLTGEAGQVTGLDLDPKLLAAAQAFVQEEGFKNILLEQGNAYSTGYPTASFDLVHARFLFAPLGRDAELLAEMLRLVKPGGILAIQEPDTSSWNCFPPHPAWDRLRSLILEAFKQGGGDFNAGRRTFGMLRRAGLQEVKVRAAVHALHGQHPYMQLPIQFANSLRPRILGGNLASQAELDQLIEDYRLLIGNPETFVTTFIVNQAWGRMAAQAQ